jgi:hypothetical protein
VTSTSEEETVPRYLISFDEGAMDFPASELPAVTEASLAVVAEAERAGVWVYGAGLRPNATASTVGTDGAVVDVLVDVAEQHGTRWLGGFCIVDVPTRDEALGWAAKIAVACRCAQEVRELLTPPD